MSLTVATQPAEEPITVDRLIRHLRMDDMTDAMSDDEREDLGQLIAEAREYAEEYQGRAYITQTLQLHVPIAATVTLPRAPFQSVNWVIASTITDQGTTVSTSDYTIDRTGTFPVLTFDALPADAVSLTVEYVAGWEHAAAVPARIKRAILLLCGHWYENREPIGGGGWMHEMTHTVKAILDLDRVQWGAL
jgi:uncharacterized phiE125 gp8 family phage protein